MSRCKQNVADASNLFVHTLYPCKYMNRDFYTANIFIKLMKIVIERFIIDQMWKSA